jgi:hypothetical protein
MGKMGPVPFFDTRSKVSHISNFFDVMTNGSKNKGTIHGVE